MSAYAAQVRHILASTRRQDAFGAWSKDGLISTLQNKVAETYEVRTQYIYGVLPRSLKNKLVRKEYTGPVEIPTEIIETRPFGKAFKHGGTTLSS